LRAVPRISGKTLALAQATKELDAGGRILDAVVRPYATKTAGVPLKFEYEMATGSSAYSRAVPLSGPASETDEENTAAQQQVHVSGPSVHTSPLTGHPPLPARDLRDGDTYDAARQTFFVLPRVQIGNLGNVQAHVRKVRVRFDPPVGEELPNDLWGDFAALIAAVLVVLFAFATYLLL